MLKYNHVRHLDYFIWQIFKIGCIAGLLSLLVWSNDNLNCYGWCLSL